MKKKYLVGGIALVIMAVTIIACVLLKGNNRPDLYDEIVELMTQYNEEYEGVPLTEPMEIAVHCVLMCRRNKKEWCDCATPFLYNRISTTSPSALCTSTSFQPGCFFLKSFKVFISKYACALESWMSAGIPGTVCRTFVKIKAVSRFKKSPVGMRMLILVPSLSFTYIFIDYSTKMRTMSPSADSTSTRLPIAPWRTSSIIWRRSMLCRA